MSTKKLKVHFIGIGGIGVSALAQYYLAKGHQVSGSDLVSSEITEALKRKGAKLLIGKHKAKNLSKDIDLVIYSPAVQPDNPELLKAKSYPEALGELTKKHFTIAIAGTHGKSTTCAMVGLLLTKAGLDPTVIVGTKVKEFNNSNCRVAASGRRASLIKDGRGKSKYLVIEADEWQASFLNYWPKIIVLTNIEAEHLDYYKNLNNILKTYKEYIRHLPEEGYLIANKNDKNIRKILRTKIHPFLTAVKNILYFSLKQKEAKKLRKILKVPGEHNVYNALAALTVARVLKIPDKISYKALSEYKGSWRRFEIIKKRGLTLISDYAHHPTEIKATLKAARERFPTKKIWCIFQPHQYQRTYYLFDDFVKVFKAAPIDRLIITDIYDVAGREEKKIKEKVSSKKLIKAINKPFAVYLPKGEILGYLKQNLKSREVAIIMGAGDIYNLAEDISSKSSL